MNYSPGTAIGFYVTHNHLLHNVKVVCRACFNSDSELVADEPIYPPIAVDCDYCGNPL